MAYKIEQWQTPQNSIKKGFNLIDIGSLLAGYLLHEVAMSPKNLSLS